MQILNNNITDMRKPFECNGSEFYRFSIAALLDFEIRDLCIYLYLTRNLKVQFFYLVPFGYHYLV